jgi:hypothetical protein
MLDGIGVEAAQRIVEHDSPERLHAEMCISVADQPGDRGGRIVVILEQHSPHTGSASLLDGVDVIDQPRHHGGAAVAMQIDSAAHKRVDRRLARSRNVVAHGPLPLVSGRRGYPI